MFSFTSFWFCLAWTQIREEIDKFGIKVYQFPECDSDEDEEFKQQDRELKVRNLLSRVWRIRLMGVWVSPEGTTAALLVLEACASAAQGTALAHVVDGLEKVLMSLLVA